MIIDEYIKTSINYMNIDYYKSIGYSDIKCNQKIEIRVDQLPLESNLKINVRCDICGNEKLLSYQKYKKNIRKYNLYTCNTSCAQFKNKLTLKDLYGSENFNRSEENKLKIKKKYDEITKEIEDCGYIKCSKCLLNNDVSDYLKNTNGRYKKICKSCRNKSFYEKRNENPHIKAWRSILRGYISRIGFVKNDRTYNLLKYTPTDLKDHISNKFVDNMSWDNYGDWHIDHIVHISLFKKDTPPYIVNSLNNLRPLKSIDNISRHNNLDDDCLRLIPYFETYIKDEYINIYKNKI